MTWKGESVISVEDFTLSGVLEILDCADICRAAVLQEPNHNPDVLSCCKNKVAALVFYEPSTRTNCSFASAMLRLGGTYFQVNESSSSVKKGETLQDTMKCLACYADVVVLRHPEIGSASLASSHISKPLLNAGDGAGEHPTQALLDLYTIIREQGGVIEGLTITLIGDLKYGRTTHSLAKLLSLFPVTINYVAVDSLQMPQSIKDYVTHNGKANQNSYDSLDTVLSTSDILYVTRVQKERFDSEEEYLQVKDRFILTAEVVEKLKYTCSILHPLPRVNEITEDVDTFPNAAYFRQMENGMYVRMALLGKVLGVL